MYLASPFASAKFERKSLARTVKEMKKQRQKSVKKDKVLQR